MSERERINAGTAEPIITARVKEFCRMSGIGRRKVFELIKSGELKSIKFGRLTLIDVGAYKELLLHGKP